jgi:hypothetical protein
VNRHVAFAFALGICLLVSATLWLPFLIAECFEPGCAQGRQTLNIIYLALILTMLVASILLHARQSRYEFIALLSLALAPFAAAATYGQL